MQMVGFSMAVHSIHRSESAKYFANFYKLNFYVTNILIFNVIYLMKLFYQIIMLMYFKISIWCIS